MRNKCFKSIEKTQKEKKIVEIAEIKNICVYLPTIYI